MLIYIYIYYIHINDYILCIYIYICNSHCYIVFIYLCLAIGHEDGQWERNLGTTPNSGDESKFSKKPCIFHIYGWLRNPALVLVDDSSQYNPISSQEIE